MTQVPSLSMNNGNTIPQLGFGVWQVEPDEVEKAIGAALDAGYRHIDTAAMYGNEEGVGRAIAASGIDRSELFITTKLNNDSHGREESVAALEESLGKLGLDYVDLYLIHWPSSSDPEDLKKHLPDWDFVKTWEEMQKLPESGRVKNIGVSNFGIKHFEKLFAADSFKTTPAVNQIELHPNCPSPKLIDYCKEKGIHCTAYSCLGSTNSPLAKDETLAKLAEKKGMSVAQVLLLWGLQRGTSVIPKSVTESRIQDNFKLDGVSLTDEEMKTLSGLPDRFKVCGDSWLPIKVFFGDDE